MDGLNCTNSDYLTIFQCYFFSTYIDSRCSNHYDATVYCCKCINISLILIVFVIVTTRIWNSNPFPGMIRLHGNSYSNQGRVEVYCNGQWGRICDDRFSSNEAETVCRQLGYNSFYNYNHLNYMLVILLLAK